MNRKELFKVIVATSLMIVLAQLMLACSSSESTNASFGPPPTSLDVYGSIEQGDFAFSFDEYDKAYAAYQQAEITLARQLQFERNSPSVNVTLLQHYYNTEILLKARMELALIAKEISRMDQSPSPHPSGRPKKVKR